MKPIRIPLALIREDVTQSPDGSQLLYVVMGKNGPTIYKRSISFFFKSKGRVWAMGETAKWRCVSWGGVAVGTNTSK